MSMSAGAGEKAHSITTVTLNAAIDKTYYMPTLEVGRVSRVPRMFAVAGGKGINVARVLQLMGADVSATGFVGGHNGAFIEQGLRETGIVSDFVRVDGESRLCLNFIDESTGASTEFLEPGPTIEAPALDELRERVRALARSSAIVSFSGSMPKGVPADFYAELVAIARGEGALVFLDASGDALKHGVAARPDAIKPNEDEVAQLLGVSADQEGELRHSLVRLAAETDIPCICVSLGGEGSLTLADGRFYRVRLPKIDVVNTVGCGDSFLAGLAAGRVRGLPTADCLKLAAAAGTANALQERAGFVDPQDVERLLALVEVEESEI